MEIIELARRASDVTVMVEFLETAKKLLATFAEQRGDVMRAQKTVATEQTQNLRVTRSEFHRRKLFRAAKTWMSGEGHALILPESFRSSKSVGQFASGDSARGSWKTTGSRRQNEARDFLMQAARQRR